MATKTKKKAELEWKRGRRGDNLVAERMIYEDRGGIFRVVRVIWLGPRGRDETGRLVNHPDDWEALELVQWRGESDPHTMWNLLGRRRSRAAAERLCLKRAQERQAGKR
jgi:hypothetical protein